MRGRGYAYAGMGFPFDALEICACARFDVPRRGGGIANGSYFYVCLSAASVSASVYVSFSVSFLCVKIDMGYAVHEALIEVTT